MFSKGFSSSKCKPALVQSIIRIGLLRNKRTIDAKKKKINVASLLAEDKIEKARLVAEQIVQIDFFVEALDILELMCGMIRDNCKLIEMSKEKFCSDDIVESISTVFYCTDRVDIPEFKHVRKQLLRKFGEEYLKNQEIFVNERLKLRLSAKRPNAYIVLQYMKEIAFEKNISWEPDEYTEVQGTRTDAAMNAPSGLYVRSGSASGLGLAAYQVTDGTVVKECPTSNKYKVTDVNQDKNQDFIRDEAELFNKYTQTSESHFTRKFATIQTKASETDLKQNIPEAVMVKAEEEAESGISEVPDVDDLKARLDRLQNL